MKNPGFVVVLVILCSQKLTVPCMLNFHLPVQPNSNDKWGQADVKISQDTPKCLCERNTCRGSITFWLRDASTGQTLPGPHTSMTIEWDESGDFEAETDLAQLIGKGRCVDWAGQSMDDLPPDAGASTR